MKPTKNPITTFFSQLVTGAVEGIAIGLLAKLVLNVIWEASVESDLVVKQYENVNPFNEGPMGGLSESVIHGLLLALSFIIILALAVLLAYVAEKWNWSIRLKAQTVSSFVRMELVPYQIANAEVVGDMVFFVVLYAIVALVIGKPTYDPFWIYVVLGVFAEVVDLAPRNKTVSNIQQAVDFRVLEDESVAITMDNGATYRIDDSQLRQLKKLPDGKAKKSETPTVSVQVNADKK